MSSHLQRQSACSQNSGDYRQVVLVRIYELLNLGYRRINRASYRTAHEDDISGDLADSIDDVLDDGSHEWMDLFHVHNEAPVRDPKRKGKHRRKVDIRICSAHSRPRTRFAFEAKLLRNGKREGQYLGKHGLGRFLRGEYAREEDTAGMLGYVQWGPLAQWAQRIGNAMARSPQKYRIVKGGDWKPNPLVQGLEHSYLSTHSRETVERPIDIYHTLLDFSQEQQSSERLSRKGCAAGSTGATDEHQVMFER
jgi:hypothetical protein